MFLAANLAQLWSLSTSPPDLDAWFQRVAVDCAGADLLAALKFDQKRRWNTAEPWPAEVYIARLHLPHGINWPLELAIGEFEARWKAGKPLSLDVLSSRFPELSETLRQRLANPAYAGRALDSTQILPLPHETTRLGRYRLDGILGRGAFGCVYEGYDEELQRKVAIKVPLAKDFESEKQREAWIESFLTEARQVASLSHDGLAAIYDFGRSAEGDMYVVYRLIQGRTLKEQMREGRSDPQRAAELLIAVAESLQYAHDRLLVHQDVKPANIMIENETGKPIVIDFGLAIRASEATKNYIPAGTPHYMSPEQARGEGHRISGRSDVFALGVILYQLITGQRPFRGEDAMQVLASVITTTPAPPRTINPAISPELERICLKALAMRPSDRYTAAEFAADLRAWLQPAVLSQAPARSIIKPRGLRSFTEEDADFFLDLLPGNRDRAGLPESIAFWKQRIEESDAARTFGVALLYGPSGCGKSSLVKAGLLPRLHPDVIAIYLEATPDRTEQQLCEALRRRLPELPKSSGLAELMQFIRLNPGRKVAIFLDQFEQWLHGNTISPATDLVRGLGQCSGEKLQVVLMIRDDFFVSTSRLMKQIDLEIVTRHNCLLVDLFDTEHAGVVLRKFGNAYGKLPDPSAELQHDQQQFVRRVVAGLAEDQRVIPVRLALFADMLRTRPWSLETLEEIGGSSGVGAAFLEETLDSPRSDKRYRLHQQALRNVLRALLPTVATEIKGGQQTVEQLQSAARYETRPADFADVISILDRELRLITPAETDADSVSSAPRTYQLTHDYLVPSLRSWLSCKQQETPAGRAELLLESLTALWTLQPENRHLPSLFEYLRIRRYVRARGWTAAQQELMRRAGKRHLLRTGTVLALLLIGFIASRYFVAIQRAKEFANSLPSVAPGRLMERLQQADRLGTTLVPLLRPLVIRADSPNAASAERLAALAARLALVPHDRSQVSVLSEELLGGDLAYVPPIRERLEKYAEELRPQWQTVLRDQRQTSDRRFRAALGLAGLDGNRSSVEWTAADLQFVAEQLVDSFSEDQPQLRDLLRPLAEQLVPVLDVLFDAETSNADQQINAAMALADYAATDIERLAALLTRATQRQAEILYPKVSAHKTGRVRDELIAVTKKQPAENLSQTDRVRLGRRRANAAITLLRQGERNSYFDALRVTDDPESLSQFIHRCRAWGVTPTELIESLDQSQKLYAASAGSAKRLESRVLYGLLLSLGNYSSEEIPQDSRERLFADLKRIYTEHPSAAVHSAAGWLLRHWGQREVVDLVDETEVPYDDSGERDWFRWRISVIPNEGGFFGVLGTNQQPRTFFLTFVVFPAGEYQIGSPDGERDRENNEVRRVVKISRPVALCDREVTWDLYNALEGSVWQQTVSSQSGVSPAADDAAFGVNWFEWVSFCRRLTQARFGSDESFHCYEPVNSLPQDGNGDPLIGELLLDRCGFRMPTESEWELGARSGQRTPWNFGSDAELLGDYEWYVENAGRQPQASIQKRPTIGGLYGMQGNAHEWTHDWSDRIYSNRTLVDPQGPLMAQYRVLRGGRWDFSSARNRLAYRAGHTPSYRDRGIGFRLALSPSVKPPAGAEIKPAP
jgi:serine/threonine protein kinase/formylglycine-generating enzyme required for sulfatase activity